MASVYLHDKNTIERVLRRNVPLNIYALGDLDDFFWPYTTWYATESEAEISEIALLYIGGTLPTLLAISEKPDSMNDLLGSISHLLPQRYYAHLSPGVESVLSRNHQLESQGEHLKMALIHRSALDTYINTHDWKDTCVLGYGDLNEAVEFYERYYPGHWFNPRMLKTNQYFGIRKNDALISVAGIHIYSAEYKVAALGNIATAPSFRNKGYATLTTARTCQSLLETVTHIGLNVRADNASAISSYKKLGFEIVASYGEYMVKKK